MMRRTVALCVGSSTQESSFRTTTTTTTTIGFLHLAYPRQQAWLRCTAGGLDTSCIHHLSMFPAAFTPENEVSTERKINGYLHASIITIRLLPSGLSVAALSLTELCCP
jgi:hypothetical protein